jgi:hypothetical protein
MTNMKEKQGPRRSKRKESCQMIALQIGSINEAVRKVAIFSTILAAAITTAVA